MCLFLPSGQVPQLQDTSSVASLKIRDGNVFKRDEEKHNQEA